jgi:phage repressor protein C with HTH and peptisase S24 domain
MVFMFAVYSNHVHSVNRTAVYFLCDGLVMSEAGERLKRARESAGFKSARSAALRFGWTPSTYASHENGQSQPPPKTIPIYAKAFKVTPEFILFGSETKDDDSPLEHGEPSPITSIDGDRLSWHGDIPGSVPEIDVYGGMGAGGIAQQGFVSQNGNVYAADAVRAEWLFPAQFLEGDLRAKRSRAHVIEVRGDSMEPTLLSGDRVIIDTSHNRPSPDGVYAIEGPLGDVVVKRLQVIRNSDPLSVRIISDNPKLPEETIEIEGLRVIGRVAGRITRM